ncbi:MAG: rhodanese-like domain-containing protein [Candidatus Sericytochromatia bacterium]|nr:rhodanese-like domain-containing protein [Candidatus Sericytochromatia bacterium]
MAPIRETLVGLAVVAGVGLLARTTLASALPGPAEPLPRAVAPEVAAAPSASEPAPTKIDWAKELPGDPEGERKVPRITVEELARMLSSDTPPVILDAREHRAFEAGHLPGAIEMGLRIFPSRWRSLPPGSKVVAYCTCPEEHTAARVAYILNQRGFEASALKGGLEAWRASGHEVVTAPAFPATP